MSERTLPAGPWQTLFPQALRLIDEIAEHGGKKDPFFTFGGGTVLMLRHQHRMSKDIDIFVPDPQSLGFVTPRLSEIAEEICNAKYVEAANYVKLFREEGEIDFVASPNLLPDEHAFERWDLFGRSVRVESSAEIVAKKMYHRGAEATARDLFDLALVIEREPSALTHAESFMYRHLDAFTDNLKAPSERYIAQFNSIETLDYNPSLEQAVSVATAYLGGLRATREKSAEEAASFIAAHGLAVQPLDLRKGEYCGAILHRTEHHLVQDVGRSTAVVHQLQNLPQSLKTAAVGEASIKLRYAQGSAAIVNRPAREASKGLEH